MRCTKQTGALKEKAILRFRRIASIVEFFTVWSHYHYKKTNGLNEIRKYIIALLI
ncbi:hypothetical protein ACFSO7_08655 [Bacillus sp. CGMCC 1.16607]|uniref:hypothetical protein n=1 Tax=Bacillus sp. CGMCC 1.16607 TaxID=3351842 RepID=UPI00362E6D3D